MDADGCPGSHGVDQGSSADLPICTGVIARLWSGCVAVQRLSPGVAILPFVLGRCLRLHILPYGTKDRPIYLWASRARAKPPRDLVVCRNTADPNTERSQVLDWRLTQSTGFTSLPSSSKVLPVILPVPRSMVTSVFARAWEPVPKIRQKCRTYAEKHK